jgi:hypothetical protein
MSDRAVAATLVAGRPVEVAVVLRPAGQLSIRNDFQDGTGTLSISPGSHDFGELTEGAPPPAVTFTVRNTGGLQLPNVTTRIDLVTGTGLAFRAGSGCAGVTLAPGAQCTIEVRAVPAPWLVPGVGQTANLVVTSAPGATATATLKVMPR